MGATLHQMPSACPACDAGAIAVQQAGRAEAPQDTDIVLSVPKVHCAACISLVENTLLRTPGVHDARVNLTLRRVSIRAVPDVTSEALVTMLEHIGYEAHELDQTALNATAGDREGRNLLMRLAVAGFASMNVMLLSVAVWSGAEDATRDMFHWISAAITLPAIVFSAQPFFANAFSALKVGRLNMDVPIVLAIALALLTSLWETTLSGEHAYFDAALTLVFFLLAGRYLDFRTRAAARSAAQELAALEVPNAFRFQGDSVHKIAVRDLRVGDKILVKPGGRIPVDGEIIEGQSELDRALLTGESRPVYAAAGQKVCAGEVNLSGPLTLRVDAIGRDSSLQKMADLVAVAESGRARYTSLADKAAKLYAPGVHILSALAFVGWYLYSQDLRVALNISAAVLIITCPCALGLAVPAVTTAASARLFRMGFLVKNATALERLAEADTVVFDKTGTLTQGVPILQQIERYRTEDLMLAAALAAKSSHPYSVAITKATKGLSGTPAVTVTDIEEIPGHGVQAVLNGQRVRLGRSDWVGGDSTDASGVALRNQNGEVITFEFQDALREGAQEAVTALKQAGKSVLLLSGDAEKAVGAAAETLCIPHWRAGQSPAQKAKEIEALAADGHKVLMVGDGLNDTAALTAAHVSIAPASALDVARVASDIVLLGCDLKPLAEAIEISQTATRRIKENFRIATVYNVVAVPLAIAGLATPLVAAIAMSASSITVSLNALRLRGRL